MTLVEGFQVFEGLAEYRAPEFPDGIEVIVSIGERNIEIRHIDEALITRWAPGFYEDNGKAFPDFVIFADETESLRPKTAELASFLAHLRARGSTDPTHTHRDIERKSERPWLGMFISLLLLVVITTAAAPLLARFQAERLAIPAIAEEIDRAFLADTALGHPLCAPDKVAEAMRTIMVDRDLPLMRAYPVETLGVDYLVLPGGRLLVSGSLLQRLPDPGALLALMAIEGDRQAGAPSMHRFFASMSTDAVFGFLFSGQPSTPDILETRAAYLDEEQAARADWPARAAALSDRLPDADFPSLASALGLDPDLFPASAPEAGPLDADTMRMVTEFCAPD